MMVDLIAISVLLGICIGWVLVPLLDDFLCDRDDKRVRERWQAANERPGQHRRERVV